MKGLLVSTIARAAGVHPETVRRLERRGLIKSHRDVNGWRRYSAETVEKLKRLYVRPDDANSELAE
jgi:DNA-binding transcriptional MerR regulator